MIARQTTALLVDAYREMNARKLFWLCLILSGLVVLVFAAMGINQRGITLLWWEFPAIINTDLLGGPALFYKALFFIFGVSVWLAWAALGLALISTASIVPDFVNAGAVELVLSKPIGRLRLLLTKYLCGILFVAIQVSVFSVASFLVIGIRGKTWEPVILLAIPFVVLIFSYLFCICALVGMVTRSAVGALLITGAFWFLLFLMNTADVVFTSQRVTYELAAAELQSKADDSAAALKKFDKEQSTPPAASGAEPDSPQPDAAETVTPKPDAPALGSGRALDGAFVGDLVSAMAEQAQAGQAEGDALQARRRILQSRADDAARDANEATGSADWWRRVTAWSGAAWTVLPKPAETRGLLERAMFTMEDMDTFRDSDGNGARGAENVLGVRVSRRAIERAVEAERRQRSGPWIIGTSLAFQAGVLLLTALVFWRRDF